MEVSIDELIAVSISEFTDLPRVPFDIFVKLPNGQFLLAIKAGMIISPETLSSQAKEELQEVWVRKADYRKFVTTNVNVADNFLNGGRVLKTQGKVSILAHATTAVFSEIERFGFSTESYIHAKNLTNNVVKIVDAKPELSQIMAGLGSSADQLIDHSIAVSTISAMIGREMSWKKDTTIEKIALGGMLHDIGKKELPKELLNKKRINFTQDDIAEYETHPYRGVQILQTVPSIPDDVISIVYEHHENSFGQGFPRRLRDARINPLARVVALANAFVNLTLPNINQPHPKTPLEAIAFIENVQGRPFNREAFLALKALVEKDSSKLKKSA